MFPKIIGFVFRAYVNVAFRETEGIANQTANPSPTRFWVLRNNNSHFDLRRESFTLRLHAPAMRSNFADVKARSGALNARGRRPRWSTLVFSRPPMRTGPPAPASSLAHWAWPLKFHLPQALIGTTGAARLCRRDPRSAETAR